MKTGIILLAATCWAAVAGASPLGSERHTSAAPRAGYPYGSVPFTSVAIADSSFWGRRIDAARRVTVPLALSKCESEGRLANFQKAAYTLQHPNHAGLRPPYVNADAPSDGRFDVPAFMGFSFDDTDVYKTIEGASYLLQMADAAHTDALRTYIDSLIDIVASAQEADGYLYTARTINPERPHQWSGAKRWSKEEDLSHELYNLGHLVDAACAHHQATGSTKLLDVARRYADCVCREVGSADGQADVVPGHQIAEMALARLYVLTGETRYLDQARYFLDRRGKTTIKNTYSQSHRPVVEQAEAVGHAVRAGYMYSGMADVAALTGDTAYVRAIDRIADDIVGRKYYLTGGVGARHAGESFGAAYELPNLTAYNETCAAISMVYLFHRMFMLHGDAKYIDCLERTLYNGVIAGMSVGGDRFFYPNPLASDGHYAFNADGTTTRQPWFGCACCPSNLSRFIPSVGGYVYGVRGRDIYVNLYTASTAAIDVEGGKLTLRQSTDYPWSGDVEVAVTDGGQQAALHLRIPGWARGEVVPSDLYRYADGLQTAWSVVVNGDTLPDVALDRGYVVVDRRWQTGDVVRLHFDMPARLVRASDRVAADRGRVAVERGPIVYCVEGDSLSGLNALNVRLDITQSPDFLVLAPSDGGPMGHTIATRGADGRELRLKPYYAWCHNGPTTMAVWLGAGGRTEGHSQKAVGVGYSQTSVNAAIFRQSSLTTDGDTQYVAYYDTEGYVTLGRRALGSDIWTLHRTQYRGKVKDAHNIISIGVDGDGYLHASFDHHGGQLRYARSVAPRSLELGDLEPMTGADEQDVTYPEFYRLAGGDLLFAYRSGASGRGNLVMNRYDTRRRTWSRVQDVLIDGENERNAYWQLTVDRRGVIHVSWVWRETWMVETNHDLCYARSTDGGRTWTRSDGRKYRLPITAATAEVAWHIPQRSELINQTSMAVDQDGLPYIATYWRDSTSDVPQYRVVWHDGSQWYARQVSERRTPFSLAGGGTKMIPMSRPRMVVDGRRAYYIFRDEERGSRVSMYYTDDIANGHWQTTDLTDGSVHAWEPTLDTELWQSRQQLHVFVQDVYQGDGERTVNVAPTLVSVLEVDRENLHDEWHDMEVNSENRLPTSAINPAQAYGRVVSLHGDWRFHWVADADQRPLDFYQTDLDDSAWGTMPVPGCWELNGYGDPEYVNIGFAWRGHFENNPPEVPVLGNHVGSYRRSVSLPAEWFDGPARQVVARFGSVTSCIYLYVNGHYVGYSEDSKVAAEFDITPYVHAGENLVAFQVMRWCDGSYCEDQDFWRLCGVARDSYIYAREADCHLADLHVTATFADPASGDGVLRVEPTVVGSGSVTHRLLDADGVEVAVSADGVVKNVRPWTAEMPYLYTLETTLRRPASSANRKARAVDVGDDTVAGVYRTRVGFRTTEVRGGQLLVNGQPILIKGVDRHEMDPDGGYVVSHERMLEDIALFKRFNINAVRTSHYPDDPVWYDLCDSLGIYVVAEANQESHGFGYRATSPARGTMFARQILERNQHNVQANFNHPSVIVWSLGNETVDGPNFTAAYRWIREADPSRPIQFEQAGRTGENTDIFCPMYLSQDGCERYAADTSFTRPLIQCEYSHAMGNSSGGFKEYWDLVRRYPKYQGGFIWDFVDQALHGTTTRYTYGGDYNDYDPSDNNFNCNGLVSPDRVPSPQMHEVGYFYQNIWTETVGSAGDGDNRPVTIRVRNENFFRDLSNVRLVWSVTSAGDTLTHGVVERLDVSPQGTQDIALPHVVAGHAEQLLNVDYELIEPEPLMAAGQRIAYAQIELQSGMDGATQDATFASAQPAGRPRIKTNKRRVTLAWADAAVTFDATTGWLTSYVVGGQDVTGGDPHLRPNFWRAPTDNDYGAGLQREYKAWRQPRLTLTSVGTSTADGIATFTASYDMPDVHARLTLTYELNSTGSLRVTQAMDVAPTDGDTPSPREMFRFGMTLDLPETLGVSEYYGRGPVETYIDRKESQRIGRYRQLAAEQFYPYIRPQETGLHSDIRWWHQVDASGHGIAIAADAPFYASALPYSIAALDDGDEKGQSHVEDVTVRNGATGRVYLAVDGEHAGVGGINSWGARPLPQHRVTYGPKSLRFVLTPL